MQLDPNQSQPHDFRTMYSLCSARCSAALVALVALVTGSCVAPDAGEASEGPWLTARFALTGDQCSDHENQDTLFPSNADRVVARVSGGDEGGVAPLVYFYPAGSQNAAGEVTIDGIPGGDGWSLEIAACQGSQTTWFGETRDLSVAIGKDLYVDVFLTPVDEVACLGTSGKENLLPSPHMYSVSLPLDERRVWLIGGFSTYDEDATQRRLDAGSWVSAYDVPTATLSAHAALLSPRAMAAAVLLDDGRALVAGGTTELYLLAASQPPLWPGVGSAPSPSVEILDRSTGVSIPGPVADLPTLPSCAGSTSGQIVCVGGVEPTGEISSTAWVIDGVSATPLDLPTDRYGATTIAAEDGSGVFVWGGQIDGEAASQGIWVSLGDSPSRHPLQLLGDPVDPAEGISLFASGAALDAGGSQDEYRFIVLGGSDAADGVLPHSTTAQTPRGELFVVKPVSGLVTRSALPLGALSDDLRRLGSQLISIGDGQVWLLGGMTSFSYDLACGTDSPCFQTDSIVMSLTDTASPQLVEERRFEIDAGPFGMSAAPLYDGSWLILGGMQDVIAPPFISRDAALLRHLRAQDDLCGLVEPGGP